MSISIEVARRTLCRTHPKNTLIIESASTELLQAYEKKDSHNKEIAETNRIVREKLGVNHLDNPIESRDKHHIAPWMGGREANCGYRRY